MAQFTIYTSNDTGAPQLTGQTGSLINVLSASLVAGYGSKSPAGWSMPFTGSFKAAFRAGSGSNQFYFQVYDNGSGSGGQQECRVRGYESMINVDSASISGSGLFPSIAQYPNGLFIRKSTAVGFASRPWILFADSRTFYIFIQDGDATNIYNGYGFGEFYSFLPNDGYRTLIIAKIVENQANAGSNYFDSFNSWAGAGGHYIPRGHYGIGNPINIGKLGNTSTMGGTYGAGTIPFTNPSNGGLYLSSIWISDPTTPPATGIRGRQRGYWQWLHPVAMVNDRDTFTGTGDLAGRTFMILKYAGSLGNNNTTHVIETSDTLETN